MEPVSILVLVGYISKLHDLSWMQFYLKTFTIGILCNLGYCKTLLLLWFFQQFENMTAIFFLLIGYAKKGHRFAVPCLTWVLTIIWPISYPWARHSVSWLQFYCCKETTWSRHLIREKHLVGACLQSQRVKLSSITAEGSLWQLGRCGGYGVESSQLISEVQAKRKI